MKEASYDIPIFLSNRLDWGGGRRRKSYLVKVYNTDYVVILLQLYAFDNLWQTEYVSFEFFYYLILRSLVG